MVFTLRIVRFLQAQMSITSSPEKMVARMSGTISRHCAMSAIAEKQP